MQLAKQSHGHRSSIRERTQAIRLVDVARQFVAEMCEGTLTPRQERLCAAHVRAVHWLTTG